MKLQPFLLPRFYPILDTLAVANCGCDTGDAAKALLASGVRILQFRHKDEWTQQEFDLASQIASWCKEARCLFILNDRADFAHLTGAGLHIGQDDLSPVAARKVVGNSSIIGRSTHNRQQIDYGSEEPVNYLALGPVFATQSKLKPDPVLGIEKFGKLRKLTTKPVVAIGGITLQNAAEVLAAGADSVAILSGFLSQGGAAAIEKNAREWMRRTAG